MTFMTFTATLTFSSYLLIRNLHSTRFSFCDIRNGPELSLINHVRVFFKLFLIIRFFSHNFRTCSLACHWSQTINLCKIVMINFLRIDLKYLNKWKQSLHIYKVINKSRLLVHSINTWPYIRAKVIYFIQVLIKQQNRAFCLKSWNGLHCFIIRVQIRHMISLWYSYRTEICLPFGCSWYNSNTV